MNLTVAANEKQYMNVRVEFDAYRRIVHVIEPLENTVEIGSFIEKLRQTLTGHTGLPYEEKWSLFWYGKNGTVGHHRSGGLYYIPLSDVRVYPEYVGEMLIRMNKNRLLG
jgi:hypothetical protein